MAETTAPEGIFPPLIFNVFKPPRAGSFDVVRHFKRNLPRDYGKIGHFGTLDPFACGVLLVGVGGAARLNDLVHAQLPKTYLAVGKLGKETDTGDYEGTLMQSDDSTYLRDTIGSFDRSFIQARLRDRFVGDYWQAPPAFSAAKHEGRPLHAWARDGVIIQKEKVLRQVYSIDVVRWCFPYLSLRVVVGSGTYIRTLFSEGANALGTIGHLIALQRESIGPINWKTSLLPAKWPVKGESMEMAVEKGISPEELLPYPIVLVPPERERYFLNGLGWNMGEQSYDYAWAKSGNGQLMGLMHREDGVWKIEINFAASRAALHTP